MTDHDTMAGVPAAAAAASSLGLAFVPGLSPGASGSYRGIVRLTAGPSHLHFSVGLPFRIGHRPFSVPWSDLSAVGDRYRGFRVVRFTLARVPDVKVRMTAAVARRLAAASGGRLPLPEDHSTFPRAVAEEATRLSDSAMIGYPRSTRFALGCLAAVGIVAIAGMAACGALVGLVALLPNAEETTTPGAETPGLQQAQPARPDDLEVARREIRSTDTLTGVWQFYRWRLCKPVVALGAPIFVPVAELELRADGTFFVTWSRRAIDGRSDPSLAERDYRGGYTWDSASGSMALEIERGPVPPDFDGTGEAFVDIDGLTLKDVWLGSPPGQTKPVICELTFRRK
jgi:hypothetical protein